MLPGLLTTDLCSLRANVVRLTFSVLWEINVHTAEIRKVSFHKAMIRSSAALAYADAQNRIDDAKDDTPLTKSLRMLNTLAKKLRANRRDRGALELASQEVRFELDSETQDPLSVTRYELRDTNRMVEEFMLLANCSVAEKILDHFPHCSVLRRHPAPKLDALENLRKLLATSKACTKALNIEEEPSAAEVEDDKGDKKKSRKRQRKDQSAEEDQHQEHTSAAAISNLFRFNSNKELADSLDRLGALQKGQKQSAADRQVNQLIRVLTTRCMNQASYFCTGTLADRSLYKHYGLAMDLYTHFTSPIRRYADVLAHRLLAHAIGYEATAPPPQLTKERVQRQCEVINLRHRMAQWCGRASANLHTFLFFKKRGPQDQVTAVVTRVMPKQIFVNVPKFGIEGAVRMDNNHDPKMLEGRGEENMTEGGEEKKTAAAWRFDETRQCFVSQENSESKQARKIQVFDEVLVRIEAEEKDFRNKTLLTFQGLKLKMVKSDGSPGESPTALEATGLLGKKASRKEQLERARIRKEMFPEEIAREAN
ncbi:unnamed protein product [Amoebophrya sp. A25]|nr:unnamed protein product [Amoebophrya sp. A25]|eukprot:GSA25T00010993001.1